MGCWLFEMPEWQTASADLRFMLAFEVLLVKGGRRAPRIRGSVSDAIKKLGSGFPREYIK